MFTNQPKTHTWSIFNYIHLWISVCLCIPTFTFIGTFDFSPRSYLNVLLFILIGSAMMGLLCGTLGYIGYKYKASLYESVSHLFISPFSKAILLFRSIVCAIWSGINIWALCDMFFIIFPTTHFSLPGIKIMMYLFFFMSNIILSRRMDTVKYFESVSANFFLILLVVCLFISDIQIKMTIVDTKPFHFTNFQSIFLIFSYWAGFATNISDFSKDSPNGITVFLGHFLGIIIGMITATLFCISLFILVPSGQDASFMSNTFVSSLVSLTPFYLKPFLYLSIFLLMTSTNIAANCLPAITIIQKTLNLSGNRSSFVLFAAGSVLCPFFFSSNYKQIAYSWIDTYSLILIPLILYIALLYPLEINSSHSTPKFNSVCFGIITITSIILSIVFSDSTSEVVSFLVSSITIILIYIYKRFTNSPLRPS